MNISKTIKQERNKLSLSQEELGERVYVTRQTISSWENGKSYPDLHSLILLSQAFDMTIDSLVKGDLEIMEQKIEQSDVKEMRRSNTIAIVCTGVAGVILSASWYLGFIPGIAIAAILAVAAIYFSIKVEKIKKQYDVQTYREIVAFTKGETLDEIAKLRESGKRGYQKFLWFIGVMILGGLVSVSIWWILQVI